MMSEIKQIEAVINPTETFLVADSLTGQVAASVAKEFKNTVGGMSGACGNGTRCIADLLSKENNKKEIILTTLSGKLKSNIVGDKIVSTEIGCLLYTSPSPRD